MDSNDEGRSARKHRQIIEAATVAFLANGFESTNMDEIATRAKVSKQTVYKHFSDKEALFAEIVLATTEDVNQIVSLITDALSDTENLERDLGRLASSFITALMQPRVLRLRRMIIASADRFPDLGTKWYEAGFERALAAMSAAFDRLSAEGLLDVADPTMAANHFVGMLLWIPINRAMFTGNDKGATKAELARHARATTAAFLEAYGPRR